MKLTHEQKKLAEENHNLIYAFLHKKNFPYEDWYDVAAIGYMYAVHTFKPGKHRFSTLAFTCMSHECAKVLQLAGYQKRKCDNLVSLDNIRDGYDEDLYSIIADQDTIAEIIRGNELFNYIINGLNERQKKVFLLCLRGYPKYEIAQRLGMHRNYVSLDMRVIRKLARNFIEQNFSNPSATPA